MHLAEEEGGSFHHGRIMSGRWEEREKQGQIVSVILSVTIMILVTISLVRKVTWNLFVGKCKTHTHTHTHTHTRTFSEKYLKCEACKLHCRGEKPDLVSEDLASSPGSADYLFSAWLNLKNSLQDWEGRTGGGGGWWLWTCVLQEVFTHPFIGTCGFGCYSVPPCYTLGFPPPGCASHKGGPVSDTRRRKHLLFTWSPSFGKATFACFCYQCPCLCQCPSASIFPESMKVGP